MENFLCKAGYYSCSYPEAREEAVEELDIFQSSMLQMRRNLCMCVCVCVCVRARARVLLTRPAVFLLNWRRDRLKRIEGWKDESKRLGVREWR